jgi:hypothetical protein
MEPYGGSLCIGCLEKRIGRKLKPNDFLRDHEFNDPRMPSTVRLRKRRGANIRGYFGKASASVEIHIQSGK